MREGIERVRPKTWFLNGLRDQGSDMGASWLLPAQERKLLARHLIGLALEEPARVNVAWRKRAGRAR
jgi:hypothetical protein